MQSSMRLLWFCHRRRARLRMGACSSSIDASCTARGLRSGCGHTNRPSTPSNQLSVVVTVTACSLRLKAQCCRVQLRLRRHAVVVRCRLCVHFMCNVSEASHR